MASASAMRPPAADPTAMPVIEPVESLWMGAEVANGVVDDVVAGIMLELAVVVIEMSGRTDVVVTADDITEPADVEVDTRLTEAEVEVAARDSRLSRRISQRAKVAVAFEV